MQSYVRRLGLELARRGHPVDFLIHEAGRREDVQPSPGIRLRYFVSLADSLAELSSGSYSDIVRVWFASTDRLAFLRHLWSPGARPRPHHYVWFVVSDSPAKRLLGMLEGLATSRGGQFFCVSPRQWRSARRWTRKASLLLPPVPEVFFLRPDQKPVRWPLRITFLGVLHPDKGVHEVIRLFEALRGDPRFECSLYATHDPTDRAQVALHERFLEHEGLHYRPMEPRPWSPSMETEVQAVLAETDVFVQPFQSLQNTVDTPLLVLEAMASLCVVLTTPIQSIPELYGNRRFLFPYGQFVERAIEVIQGLDETALSEERARIHLRNQELGFAAADVADRFLAAARDGKVAVWR
jgi:glycosyltransferase involved in cell wall biosynthesis